MHPCFIHICGCSVYFQSHREVLSRIVGTVSRQVFIFSVCSHYKKQPNQNEESGDPEYETSRQCKKQLFSEHDGQRSTHTHTKITAWISTT